MPSVLSVSAGRSRVRDWAGIGRTSIDKTNVVGRVVVHELGLDGDTVSDTRHHGGPDQAVYAYAREDLDWWEEQLGRPVRNGQFGENLTTEGIDLTGAEVGTRIEVGDDGVVLEVALVRIPCNDFRCWMGESGFDATGWVKRFVAAGRPGPYLRVLQVGTVAAGDPVRVVHRPGHGVTVADMFAALTTERKRLPELLAVEGLAQKARQAVEKHR